MARHINSPEFIAIASPFGLPVVENPDYLLLRIN